MFRDFLTSSRPAGRSAGEEFDALPEQRRLRCSGIFVSQGPEFAARYAGYVGDV